MKFRIRGKVRAILSSAVLFAAFGTTAAGAQQASPTGGIPGAIYLNAGAPVERRVDDLLSRMTLDEKIGQMTQIAMDGLKPASVRDNLLGSVLSGGGGSPRGDKSPTGWADMVDGFQKAALSTRLGIPILYGVDSVHGNNNLSGATIFPHNIAFGAAGDADLVERAARASAVETAAVGVPWTFAPCLAVVSDPRWGRTYESYGKDSALVAKLGAAFVRGWQSADTGAFRTVTTAKHFIGDGNTEWGTSSNWQYKLDRGNMTRDENFIRTVLLPPYAEALKAGARTVMISQSSWNGVNMHAQKGLITGVLKGDLGFTGFVVSDWAGLDAISPDYYRAVVTGINAGVDMYMVPYDARKFIDAVKEAVNSKDIPMERVDDAVRRILRVKFEIGLFEKPFANRSLAKQIRSPEHLAIAREAVEKSQVVLINKGALPLGETGSILVTGNAANDIGMQCGGWTITWQGRAGNITEGTTILDGIREVAGTDRVSFDSSGKFPGTNKKATVILVTGEKTYAEGEGDREKLQINDIDYRLALSLKKKFAHVILVVASGRPLALGDLPSKLDGIVAAWLPGSEGAGVADILFGKVKPTGKLPFDWPAVDGKTLWLAGYGLGW